jgi:hypothetical protein
MVWVWNGNIRVVGPVTSVLWYDVTQPALILSFLFPFILGARQAWRRPMLTLGSGVVIAVAIPILTTIQLATNHWNNPVYNLLVCSLASWPVAYVITSRRCAPATNQ